MTSSKIEPIADGLNHQGRIVLISGASSGLGEEFALSLAKRGAKLVLGARRQDRLQALVEKVQAFGAEAIAVFMDVTDEASVKAAFDEAEKTFGIVDTVIANAGVNVEGWVVNVSMDEYDSVQNVNSRGVFMTVREAGKRLIKAGQDVSSRGRIIVLSSMGGRNVLPASITYCSSKASAVMMARGFADEWNRYGICVNALCPGYMMTEINQDFFESSQGQKFIEGLPRKRMMPVNALLPMVHYLTSDQAAYASGSVIQIDDGQLI